MQYTEDIIFDKLQKGEITKFEALDLLKKLNSSESENKEQVKEETKETIQEESGAQSEDILDFVKEVVNNILHYDEGELDEEASFKELGIDSISGVEIVRDINNKYELALDAAVLYDYSTIKLFAEYLGSEIEKKKRM